MAGKIPDEWFRPDNPPSMPSPVEAETTEVPVARTESFSTPYPRRAVPVPTEVVDETPSRGGTSRRNRVIAVFAIIGALVLGLLIGEIFRLAASPPDGGTTSAPSGLATVRAQATFTGRVKGITPTAVQASCTAPPATDSLGKEVTYTPSLAIDGQPETAWRCDGAGIGQALSFTLPENTELVRLAVFNGYGKHDPKTNDFLYPQYRRVLSVVWQLPDGREIPQEFADNGSGLQQIDIPRTTVSGEVKMRITASTAPGWATVATRDAVLISEVQFLSPAQ